MPTYQRVPENETPWDAVTVAIGGATDEDLEAGLFWPLNVVDGEVFDAGAEEAEDVEAAFTRAQDIARSHGFERIVVMLQRDSIWREGWGKLD